MNLKKDLSIAIMAKNGYSLGEIGKRFKMSFDEVNKAISNVSKRRKRHGGKYCPECAFRVYVLYCGRVPLKACCENGHNVDVVYNRFDKMFEVC